MIKRSTGNTTILNFQAPNDHLKIYKEKVRELEGEIEKHVIVAGVLTHISQGLLKADKKSVRM